MLLLGVACAAAFVAACGSAAISTANRSATAAAAADTTATLAAQATQTAAATRPVTFAVAAQIEGTVAGHDAHMQTQAVVTNGTSAPIRITNEGCPYPVVVLRLYDSMGTEVWHNYQMGIACVFSPPTDIATVAPGATYTFAETDDLSAWTSLHLQGGATYNTYKLKADLLQWHQGDVSQIGQAGVPQGQHVLAQTTITFP